MTKITLKTQAYNTIKHNITSCIYTPGSLITEELIQEELPISRTPIREALNRLEQEGLIKIAPKKGILISDISLEMINMIFETRILIEPYTIKTYGNRIPTNTLLDFYNKFEALTKHPEDCCDFDLDDSFHSLFFNASNNDYLLKTHENLASQNQRIRILTRNNNISDIISTSTEHLDIAAACIENDWVGAAEKMSCHLEVARSNSIKLMLVNTNGKNS